MNATDRQIIRLLRKGLSNAAISRQLRCDKHRVAHVRARIGLPTFTRQLPSLEEKWASFTRPLDGGHLEWTGERGTSAGTPLMRYREQSYSPAAIAFRIHHGRDAVGYAIASCGLRHCVAPAHVDDEITRHRTREQLRYLNGGRPTKARCIQGHDLKIHARFQEDGTAYCRRCKTEQRRTNQPEVMSQ
ncbi:hypothetical protein [Streptomyces sp. NPDC096153]|uniref:hypothetical protein n=1 Tax=Streptomyces sp. NPDC096153 TaxID=3155548 RepID=UPI00331A5092